MPVKPPNDKDLARLAERGMATVSQAVLPMKELGDRDPEAFLVALDMLAAIILGTIKMERGKEFHDDFIQAAKDGCAPAPHIKLNKQKVH